MGEVVVSKKHLNGFHRRYRNSTDDQRLTRNGVGEDGKKNRVFFLFSSMKIHQIIEIHQQKLVINASKIPNLSDRISNPLSPTVESLVSVGRNGGVLPWRFPTERAPLHCKVHGLYLQRWKARCARDGWFCLTNLEMDYIYIYKFKSIMFWFGGL